MSEKAKITGLKVSNFKRVKLVEIQPNENGLTILGGDNSQGKTSILNAIGYALGGEAFRPSAVNNYDGDENAEIRVEINGLIVERKGKNADLKITDTRGMKGNQTLLNEIVSKFALDLGTFLNASDKAKLLLGMFPELDDKLTKLKAESDAIRTERTDINRDVKRLGMQIDGMSVVENIPGEEIKVEELTVELQKISNLISDFEAKQRTVELKKQEEANLKRQDDSLSYRTTEIISEKDNLGEQEQAETKALEEEFQRRHEELKARFKKRKNDADTELDRLKNELHEVRTEVKQVLIDIDDLTKEIAAEPNHEEQKVAILKRIQTANDTNAQIRKNTECKKVHAEWDRLKTNSEDLTNKLTAIDQNRAELLQNANLPLPELSIDADGELLYNGLKWDCMAGAERLKVATAICMGAKPECGFVLIDGLETMDGKTLADFSAFLAEKGMQGIGTIVGNEQATLIIENGMIQAPKESN